MTIHDNMWNLTIKTSEGLFVTSLNSEVVLVLNFANSAILIYDEYTYWKYNEYDSPKLNVKNSVN